MISVSLSGDSAEQDILVLQGMVSGSGRKRKMGEGPVGMSGCLIIALSFGAYRCLAP